MFYNSPKNKRPPQRIVAVALYYSTRLLNPASEVHSAVGSIFTRLSMTYIAQPRPSEDRPQIGKSTQITHQPFHTAKLNNVWQTIKKITFNFINTFSSIKAIKHYRFFLSKKLHQSKIFAYLCTNNLSAKAMTRCTNNRHRGISTQQHKRAIRCVANTMVQVCQWVCDAVR